VSREISADTRTDVALGCVAALLGIAVVTARMPPDSLGLPVGVEAAGQVVGGVLIVGSRRRPLLVYVSCLAISVAVPVGAVCIAAFMVGRWARADRRSVITTLGGLVLLLGSWWAMDRDWQASHIVAFVAATLVGWLLGRALASSDEAAQARAEERHAAAALLAAAVRQAERDRLAGEMHDVVAHRVSLMVLDANRIEAGSAPDDRAVAAQIRDTGRAALADMREVLQRLQRDDLDKGLARHSFTEIDDLVNGVREVGQPVEVTVTAPGSQPPDLAERTAVRIVREALTNAARHAPGAATFVEIDEQGHDLLVHVRNAAPAHAPQVELTTGGHGLRALSERVALIGGQWRAGPTSDGGFAVQATLPRGYQ
jgi:signal transduction histidine kinase